MAAGLTESESLFESYLIAHGYADFWRIREGTEKQPDYGLRHGGLEVVFEVKEFDGDPPNSGFGTFDQYGPIRRKLAKAAKKFRGFKDRPCCAVLFNGSMQLVRLDWYFIAGAMFGELSVEVPLRRQFSETTMLFGNGGRMIYKGQPENTTVSATIVVRRGVFASRKAMLEIRRSEVALGRRLCAEEVDAVFHHHSNEKPSVLVVENPYAANPLPRDLFCGPHDERFGLIERELGCIFVGSDLAAMEKEEKEINITSVQALGNHQS